MTILLSPKHNPTGLEVLKLPKEVVVRYYGTPLVIQFPKETNNAFTMGEVILTKVGGELAPICGSIRNDAVMDYVVSKWIEFGYAISAPYPIATDGPQNPQNAKSRCASDPLF